LKKQQNEVAETSRDPINNAELKKAYIYHKIQNKSNEAHSALIFNEIYNMIAISLRLK
jgi:hypothetical protein